MDPKPTVFIASSSEALPIADAVSVKLDYDLKVEQWDNAFELSSITITSLINKAKSADYAVFVFHKDDELIIRGEKYSAVRDNVLFELGLFIGGLGLDKCFILVPKSSEPSIRLPSDLAGVTVTTYDDSRDDFVDAVSTSCAKIKIAVRSQLKALKLPQKEDPVTIHEQRLREAESNIWRMRHELESSQEKLLQLQESIKSNFFSIAKPATPLEIRAWENGAKDTYLKEIKIGDRNVYFVDRDTIVPSLYGAGSISVIVAEGVRLYGVDSWSHNNIYYMDGFRSIGV